MENPTLINPGQPPEPPIPPTIDTIPTPPPLPPTPPISSTAPSPSEPSLPETVSPNTELNKEPTTQKRLTTIVIGITAFAILAIAVIFIIFTQLSETPKPPVTPTPTPTPTASNAPSQTPFPTVTVKKNFLIELLDSQGLVTKVAEFSPEGTLIALADNMASSPFVYRNLDAQGKTTEIGELSSDSKLRIKRTSKTLEIGNAVANSTMKKIATAPDNQFIEGKFVSATEYFYYFYQSACGWEGVCQKVPKSAFIYNSADTKQPIRAIQNEKDVVIANYVGTTTTHHLLTGTQQQKTDTYFLINRTTYNKTKIVIPSARYEKILWGPEVDGKNGRLFYMSEGFTETAEITTFNLQQTKEDVLTEVPTLLKRAEVNANHVPTYTAIFFNDYKLAYITLTYTNKEKSPVEKSSKYYLFSLPDEQAKEITPDPTLLPLLEGKAFGKIAWNKDFSQGVVILDEMKTVLVIDSSDPFKPIGKKIMLGGTLPAYSNLRAGGWKE